MIKSLLKGVAFAMMSLCAIGASAQDTLLLYRSGKPFYRVPVPNVDSIGFAYYVEPEVVVPQPNDTTGPQYVDLGLPSGTLWATYNLGATSPEEYGQPYSWGETRVKDEFTYDESAWNDVPFDSLVKLGVVGEDGTLEPKYDAAKAAWGEEWQVPSQEQMEELFLCYSEWTTQDGVPGRRFTGPNGKTIFFPATGYVLGVGSKTNERKVGYYWTNKSVNNKKDVGNAKAFRMDEYSERVTDNNKVAEGLFIRPVMVKKGKQGKLSHTVTDSINGHAYVDLGLPSGTMWATSLIGANEDILGEGYYYQWGMIDTSKVYTEEEYKYRGAVLSDFQMNGVIDADNNLRPKYDAASVNWGSDWRMPTDEHISELVENSNCVIISHNEMSVTKVQSKINGHTLFLPHFGIAGSYFNEFYSSWAAHYVYTGDNPFCSTLYSNSQNISWGSNRGYTGLPIRPVTILK